jgi:hypothetical protein
MPQTDNDPSFGSSYLTESTSAAHLSYNDLIARISAGLVQIKQVDLSTPPPSPNDFDAYLVGTSPTGPWSAYAGLIVVWINGWRPLPLREGLCMSVVADVSGQAGRRMDYYGGGWSSFGGSQSKTAINISGTFTIQWDLKYGQVLRTTLVNATTVIEKPSNPRFGRPVYVVVQQDATGGRQIQFKTGQWRSSGGAAPAQPTSTANATTVYTALWLAPSDSGPTIIGTSLNVVNI